MLSCIQWGGGGERERGRRGEGEKGWERGRGRGGGRERGESKRECKRYNLKGNSMCT